MGQRYSGVVRSITPNTSNDNWTVGAGSTLVGKIQEFHWGGEVTTSTAMHTRIARAATVGVTAVGGNIEKLHPWSASARLAYSTGWTTQPVLNSGDLFAESWNAHGGLVRWLAAPGEEFVVMNAASISCRNTNGTATSSYGTIWEEE